MDRTPDWTIDEFETLMHHPRLTEVELKQVVPGHSAVAIAIVREGVHSWHRGQRDTTLLSDAMKEWLAQRTTPVECAVCSIRF